MGKYWDIAEFAKTARRAAAEGAVLLKNDRGALPLKDGEKIALFGRSQFHYYKSGTGSGGSVNTDYVTGIREALEGSGKYGLDRNVSEVYEAWIKDHPFDEGEGWGKEPWSQEEMPLEEALVKKAGEACDAALFVLGRTAGEDQDSQNKPGSYLLTDTEKQALKLLSDSFQRLIVILNVGNIIDMRWVKEYDPAAVIIVWQGGQEGGNAVLDVISGAVNPSGHLTDTIAETIEDYPSTKNFGSEKENVQEEDIYVGYRYFETFAKDKVLYPFGFGLSYTTFEMETTAFRADPQREISVEVTVGNTGVVPGKAVVQIYAGSPQGKLGKPARVLCGFRKTRELAPSEKETLTIRVEPESFASYDDGGAAGHRSAWILEEGTYRIYAGEDVRSAKEAGSFSVPECIVIRQCEEAMAPVKEFKRMKPEASGDGYRVSYEPVPLQTADPAEKRKQELKECPLCTGDQGFRLKDVEDGKVSMSDFLKQIPDEELIAMMRGEGMCSPKVTPGIAGAFGGVTEKLLSFGIPVAGCADGPSGIRMDCGTHAFSLPNGTCLASSFNEELSTQLFCMEALDMRRNRIDALLGPGMNIHRNPLNGRNFEYFSEDPFLSGRIAAAQLKGLHQYNATGVIKHFAANTQEHLRHIVNSVVSERALREIYLKGFEIAVREGDAGAVMSTYGPVNGIYTSANYDLLTVILRKEWGFKGIVMTDWWAMGNDTAGEKGSYKNVSSQVRAQNDLNMVNSDAGENSSGDDLPKALSEGRLTRYELVRSAENICRYLLGTPAFRHSLGEESELDRELRETLSDEDAAMLDRIALTAEGERIDMDPARIDTGKGRSTVFNVFMPRRSIYELELELRAAGVSPMAQLPVSVFKNKDLIRSVTLSGENTEWMKITAPVEGDYQNTFTLKFFFGQSGLEIRSAVLILKKDIEDEIRAAMTARRESDS